MRAFRNLLLQLLVLVAPAAGFVATSPLRAISPPRAAASMGPAKDGPFTPIVLAAKVVLGEQNLLKLRGKGIALHSQEINKFCEECTLTLQPSNVSAIPEIHACPEVHP